MLAGTRPGLPNFWAAWVTGAGLFNHSFNAASGTVRAAVLMGLLRLWT